MLAAHMKSSTGQPAAFILSYTFSIEAAEGERDSHSGGNGQICQQVLQVVTAIHALDHVRTRQPKDGSLICKLLAGSLAMNSGMAVKPPTRQPATCVCAYSTQGSRAKRETHRDR